MSTERRPSTPLDQEAFVLLPAVWKAHEYLRNEAAPFENRVNVALRLLDDALARWAEATPLPDDGDQDERSEYEKACCRTLRHERGHAEGCPSATANGPEVTP